MSLAQTLAELRDKFAKILPESATAIMEGHIASLRKNGAVEQILRPGAKAPPFTLKNQHDAKAFGLVYTFPEDLKNVYLNVVKVDVQTVNEANSWQLLIPARFVIDGNGVIRDVKADPDYRYRPEPWEVLDIAKTNTVAHTTTPVRSSTQ
jgi:hypothetical protein